MADPCWYRRVPGGWEILVHAQPGASRTRVVGLHGDALKISIKAPPVDGKANAAIIEFIAGALGVPTRSIEIAAGTTHRRKRVLIRDGEIDPQRLLA